MVVLNQQLKKHVTCQKYEEFQKKKMKDKKCKIILYTFFFFLQSQSKRLPLDRYNQVINIIDVCPSSASHPVQR